MIATILKEIQENEPRVAATPSTVKELIKAGLTVQLESGAGDRSFFNDKSYEKAGADAILIHSNSNKPDQIFEFCDSWSGSVPIITIPTTYPVVRINELVAHKIKMVIYANQTLRTSFLAMSRMLQQVSKADSLNDVDLKMSSMEEIFHIQEMYKIKNQEKNIESELKRLGYVS